MRAFMDMSLMVAGAGPVPRRLGKAKLKLLAFRRVANTKGVGACLRDAGLEHLAFSRMHSLNPRPQALACPPQVEDGCPHKSKKVYSIARAAAGTILPDCWHPRRQTFASGWDFA